MSIKTHPAKQPSEILDYDFNFADWLAARGNDSIASAVVVADAGITLESTFTINGTLVKTFVSGGTTGQKYKMTCLAQTVGGRLAELECMLPVKEV